ncbi:MAG: hypothetical protein O3A00_08430 [Planctomycetota bacterium]|nr:hypothetical protein [Planctomycetota bacterium]
MSTLTSGGIKTSTLDRRASEVPELAGEPSPSLARRASLEIAALPLAPFEHLMLADDCPNRPMSFFIQLKFQGRFDRSQLNASLKKALKLHPLLNSRIHGSVTDATSGITWIESTSPPPAIDWNNAEIPFRFATGRWMDLRTETGLRLWLRETEDSTTLILQMHHSCCDGLGAMSFIHTLLLAYHLLHTSASLSSLEEMFDPRLLRERDVSCSSWLRIMKLAWRAMFRLPRHFKNPPIPLATPRALPTEASGADQFPRFQTFTFSQADTEQIRLRAKRLGVSLNDLLLRDLFLILDHWNRRHSAEHCSQTVRVCVPVNVRRSSDYRMSAANVISLSFLDRDANQLADPTRLLADLHAQTAATQQRRASLLFVPTLKLIGMFPGRLHAHMQRTQCQASAALSNLGILLAHSPLLGRDRRAVAGGVILESMEPFMPLRHLTHAAFAVSSYGRKLNISISHDPRWIDAAESRELLESFARQLKVSMAQPNDAASNGFTNRRSTEAAPASILSQAHVVETRESATSLH